MTLFQIGLLGCLALIILLVSNMPVGYVMAFVGVIGFAWVTNPTAALNVLSADIFDSFSSYTLTVIPLFVLMRQIAFHSGISQRGTDHSLLAGAATAFSTASTIF